MEEEEEEYHNSKKQEKKKEYKEAKKDDKKEYAKEKVEYSKELKIEEAELSFVEEKANETKNITDENTAVDYLMEVVENETRQIYGVEELNEVPMEIEGNSIETDYDLNSLLQEQEIYLKEKDTIKIYKEIPPRPGEVGWGDED